MTNSYTVGFVVVLGVCLFAAGYSFIKFIEHLIVGFVNLIDYMRKLLVTPQTLPHVCNYSAPKRAR